MLVLKTIRWKNFLSTGNVFTEICLNKHNTTLFTGKNGNGKSTILDALTYVLFGKAFRKINKPQLINSINQKNMIVELEFDVGTQQYKIIRGMKPNVFEVYQNDKLLNQSSETKDYQEILEKQIIKVNYKSFCQVVVLGSATFQPFMQLSTGQRREIIEDLLDLQIFSKMNNILKDKLMLNGYNLNDITNEKKLLQEKIKLIKEHNLEIQNSKKQFIKEKEESIVQTENNIKNLDNKIEQLNSEISILGLGLKNEKEISNKINKLSGYQHKIEAKVSVLQKEVSFFENNDNCPTCKQQIELNFKTNVIGSKNKEIEESKQGLSLLLLQLEESNKELNALVEIHSNIRSLEMDLRTLQVEKKSLFEYVVKTKKEIEKNAILKESSDDKISDLEKELKKVEIKYLELIDEKQTFNSLAILLKDGGIKSRIIKQYIPIINKLINKYLSSMEFMCQFELNENFEETLKSRYRDEFSYASFSEGEKSKIDLAILFTWRTVAKMRNSINTNILIFDEVLDSSLDSNSIDSFMEILKTLADDSNIFIISHREQMVDKFEKVVKFKKVKNFSSID